MITYWCCFGVAK